jgi:hypothetical protein
MTVYAVRKSVDYETSDVVALYSTVEKAEKALDCLVDARLSPVCNLVSRERGICHLTVELSNGETYYIVSLQVY